jgi:hypothetical protein
MAKGRILLVNACINRGESRTLRLARRVVSGYPDHDVEELVLEEMGLRPADSDFINRRTRLVESGRFDDPIFDIAKKFASAEGGTERIVWMPKELKDDVAERLNKTAKELYGIDNYTDMIADETITTDPEELLNWLTEKGHPVLGLEPLM